MKKGINITFTIISFVMTIASFVAYFTTNIDWLFVLSIVVCVLQILIIVFCLWAWRLGTKIPFIRDLLPKDINGSYKGEIKYNFKGESVKVVNVSVKQNLYGLKLTLETGQILSESVSSQLESEDGFTHIRYIYKTISRLDNNIKKNPESFGAADLVATGESLEGKYWTTNQTIGFINVKKECRGNKRGI